MKYLLTVVCALGFLCGGVFTMYAAVSIGSNGLSAMGTSLQSISTVMATYFKNLNDARTKVMTGINSLTTYTNATYKALNSSYGASQQNLQSLVYNLEWFTQQFTYGEQQVNSVIGNDLNQLNNQLQQTMDQILQSYNMLVSSMAYQQNAENCTVKFTPTATSVPNQLTKFGTCLKTEVDTVPLVVTPLLNIFQMVQSDLVSLNNQLKICASTSTNCINEYFMDIYMELSNVNMELYMALSLLNFYQYDASQRNQLCGELIKYNVQDVTQNLAMQFSQCMYPQTS